MKRFAKLIGLYLNGLALISKPLAGKQGFFIFCHPFSPGLKEHQADFLNTASRKVDLVFQNRTVKTYHWGTGQKRILFLHGWQSNSFHWKRFIEQFDHAEYTLIAIDAPAHGASEGKVMNIPIYVELVAQLLADVGGVHAIIGHSMGGFAAMHYLHERPNEVHPPMAVIAAPGHAEDFFLYFRDLVGISRRAEGAMRVFFHQRTGHEVDYYDSKKYGPHLNGPGLVIHDEGDLEVPVHYAQTLHHAWPNSKLHITRNAGHRMKSTDVVDLTIAFVSQHTAALHPELVR
ncbi:MAG: alpha/beta hydrolase [Flavobacteriales bacterium]|jgi:pimeloyl-ACP methyl ester carboxylesterase|nr:alpha/beta hydrolase [Flavobacteriales bacterium]